MRDCGWMPEQRLPSGCRQTEQVTKPFLGATDKVLVYNNDTNSETITTDKDTIEHVLSQQNKRKFTDAYSSPFLHEPLISIIGQHAITKESQDILDGNFQAPKRLKITRTSKI